MEELWQFSGRTLLIVVLVSALWAATAGWAIAWWGRLPPALGALVGAIGQAPAVLVLGIVAIVRESGRRRFERSLAGPTTPVAATGSSWDDSSGWGSPAPAASTSGWDSDSGAGWGSDSDAGWGADSRAGWDADPVLPLVDASRGTARRPWREVVLTNRWILVAGGVAALVLTATLVSPWLRLDAGIIPAVLVFPIGTGLDVLVLVGIAIALAAVVVLGFRRSRIAAIVLASVADLWLLFALVTLSARESVARVLAEVGAFELTVGDALRALGIDAVGGVVELPEGVDLSPLGLTGDTIDLTGVELGAVIPNIDVQISVGIYLLIAFAVLANVAVVLVLRAPAWRVRGSADDARDG